MVCVICVCVTLPASSRRWYWGTPLLAGTWVQIWTTSAAGLGTCCSTWTLIRSTWTYWLSSSPTWVQNIVLLVSYSTVHLSLELNVCISMLCQINPRSLPSWMEPSSCSSQAWLISSSCTTCSPQTRGSKTKTGDKHRLMKRTVAQCTLKMILHQVKRTNYSFNVFIWLTAVYDRLFLGSGLSPCTRRFRRRTRVLLSQCHLLELERYFLWWSLQ